MTIEERAECIRILKDFLALLLWPARGEEDRAVFRAASPDHVICRAEQMIQRLKEGSADIV